MVFIEKEAKQLRQYQTQRQFTASARAATKLLLRERAGMDGRGILLPAYIGLSKVEGSGVFDPVRETDIPFAFYAVSDRLIPDLGDIKAQLETGNFQIVFLIHYFGIAQVDIGSFVEMCHSYGAIVIEDCAHTLLGGLGTRRLGSFGDYSIFSIHKSISTQDGGFFIDRSSVLPNPTPDMASTISLSSLATFANTNLESISIRRKENYARVASHVKDSAVLELFWPHIDEYSVPLNCPVIVPNGKREALYFRLIELGILPTALYHTLIPEISAEQFPDSHHVANNILNLPTHPDISDADFEIYFSALTKAVREII